MGYLRLYDYLLTIQDVQLQQLTTSNPAVRIMAEGRAQDTATSYLSQKYDMTDWFRDTVVFDPTKIYKAKQLVELNFPAYVPATTYTGVGTDLVVNNKLAYVLKTTGATGTFDPTKWTLLGNQYDLFYVPTPYDEFELTAPYMVGDFVFYKDNVYKCLIASIFPDHETELQGETFANIPAPNIFPDNKFNGKKYWGVGVPYFFSNLFVSAVNTDFTAWSNVTAYVTGNRVDFGGKIYQALTSNTNVSPDSDFNKWQTVAWTAGDNRYGLLIQVMTYITIYFLLPRISQKTVPQKDKDNYQWAMDWLNDAARGEITADLPKLQPMQGTRNRYGGNIPMKTFY